MENFWNNNKHFACLTTYNGINLNTHMWGVTSKPIIWGVDNLGSSWYFTKTKVVVDEIFPLIILEIPKHALSNIGLCWRSIDGTSH